MRLPTETPVTAPSTDDTSRVQPKSPQVGTELAMSQGPGIPGLVVYSTVPGVNVADYVRNTAQLNNLQFTGSTLPMSEAELQTVANVLRPMGNFVFMKSEDDIGRPKCDYHMYSDIQDKNAKALREAVAGGKNNIVDFGNNLRKMGGEIADVLDRAAKAGGTILVIIVTLLWEAAKGLASQAANDGSGIKDSRNT